jgi:hypothetical protein
LKLGKPIEVQNELITEVTKKVKKEEKKVEKKTVPVEGIKKSAIEPEAKIGKWQNIETKK